MKGMADWICRQQSLQLLLLTFLLAPTVHSLPNFNVTSQETSIAVSWTADPSTTLKRFEIYVDGSLKFTGDSSNLQTASNYTVLLLRPGQQYEVVVEGINMEDGRISLFTKTHVTKPRMPVLNPVGQSDVTTSSIRLTWFANPQSLQSNFRLEYQDISTSGPLITEMLTPSETEYIMQGLKPGHNYSITIYAISDTQFSLPNSIFENTVPKKPNITSLSTISMDELYLTWTAAPDSIQSSFRVTYEKMGSNSPTEVTGCSQTWCNIITDQSIPPGGAVNVKVYAIQGSRPSRPAIGIGNTKPVTVRNLQVNTAQRQANSLMVIWEEPAIYTTFRVTVEPDEGTGSSPSKDRGNWTFTQNGLLSGKQYLFSVYTLSGKAESDPQTVSAYTRPPQPPAPMRAESDTVDTLDVKWSAPQSVGNFDWYRVSVSQAGMMARTIDVSKSSTRVASFGSLRPGAKYKVSLVTVVGDNVESQASIAELYVKPLSPRNLSLTAQAKDQLTVRWDIPPATPTNDFSGFVISVKDMPNSVKNLSYPSTLEATFSNLNPGTLYTVQVSTISGSEVSTPTIRSYYTRPNMARSLRQVAVTNNAITVEWTAPAPVGNNAGYDGYQLKISTSDGNPVATTDLGTGQTTYKFPGLYPGTQYLIELFSYILNNNFAPGTFSDPASLTVLTRPDQPLYLQLTEKTSERVTVRWESPGTDSMVQAYLVRIVPSNPTEYSPERELTNNDFTYTYDGLQPGRTYTVEVYSKLGDQQSEPATLILTMNPSPVRNLMVSYSGTTSVEIVWDEPFGSSFDAFRISVKNHYNQYKEEVDVSGQTRKYEIDRLSAGQQYSVAVTTLSNNEPSSSVKINFATSPEGVATIEPVDIKTDAIEIRWSAPNRTEFSGYDLSISPNDGGLALPIHVSRTDDLMYRFMLLQPGKVYNISIKVVTSHGSVSTPFFREIGTMPSKVINARSQPLSTSAIRVSWEVDTNSMQTKFTVSYGIRGGSFLTEDVTSDGRLQYVKDLIDLLPGAQYEIAISAFSSAQSLPVTLRQATEPKPVQDLQVITTGSETLRLTWGTAGDSRQTSFMIRYRGQRHPNQGAWEEMEVTGNEATISNLFPGERYAVEIKARSYGVDSQVVSKTQNTYPLPPANLALDLYTLQSDSARVTWSYDPDTSYVLRWKVTYGVLGVSSLRMEWVSVSVQDMTLTGLTAGQTYTIQVYGVTDMDLLSVRPATITITTKPLLTTDLTKDSNATTTDTLVIKYTENAGQFDHYVFSIEPEDADPIMKQKGAQPRVVTFTGLTAGFTYTVGVLTVSGDVSSQRQTKEFNTRPAPPTVMTSQDNKSITVIISRPMGFVHQYLVKCSVPDPPKGGNAPATCGPQPSRTIQARDDPMINVIYDQLKPHTRYKFTVTSKVNNDISAPVIRFAKTNQATPGPVGDLTAEPISPSKVQLSWSEPIEKNGEILKYEIYYQGNKPNRASQVGSKTVEAPASSAIIDDLKGGYDYTFTVQAVTIGPGRPDGVSVQTPIGSPHLDQSLSADQMRPRRLNDSVQYDRFAVQLVDPFTDQDGEVVAYTVIVTTDLNDPLVNAPTLPYWSDNVGHGRPGAYQAIQECAELFLPDNLCAGPSDIEISSSRRHRALNDRTKFVVGSEVCNPDVREYCNGRLSPSTTYYAKLRGFTENGKFTDTPFSEPISTATAPPDGSVQVLVSVIVVLVLLFIVLGLVILFVLRRRGIICSGEDQLDSFSRSSTGPSIRISLRDSFRKRKQSDFTRPIKVEDFVEHVKKMSADSYYGFAEEYEDLRPVGRDQSTYASEMACNRNKNRFTNILPYDHSRVKLLPTDDEEGTDYINANYMPGFNSKREFIVTQGPLPSTRDDFWRMVWEQNCRAIVMLTKCVEKGREKCDHYWPIDSEPMFYGDLQVLILNETKCPEWIVTEFRISKGEQSRNIKHFHYIAWPDFGVPQQPQSLIRFVRLVRSKMPADGGPIIAHCSAGVGRSGAYIAIDHIIMDMAISKTVDVFSIVYSMRLHRSQMVQTEAQYICIHDCLKCVIEGSENETDPYLGEDNDGFDDDEGITMESN